MYRDKTIAVVVPAYNEENLIGRVIDTMGERSQILCGQT